MYRRLVGKLNYLTNTRPNITFSVQHLGQLLKEPKDIHLKASLHVFIYVRANPRQSIVFNINPSFLVETYYDSD